MPMTCRVQKSGILGVVLCLALNCLFLPVTDSMKDLKVEVLDRALAWGFYRWPTAWHITWTGQQGPATLSLKQVTRTGIWNWAIGGFSMAVVQSELRSAGKQQEVYGLVELIM
jgi:hypothetical protein